MFDRMEQQDIERLIALTAPDRVLTGDAVSEDYSHDELGGVSRMPDALVRVLSTDETAAVLRYANERRIPVVVRGSGTGLVGAAVALHGGIMLETTGMDRILELDRDNMTVTVQPGVLLMELAAFCEREGFLYPPDPGEKSATIGGNISTNAGGMRAVKYGVTRDYVRGLTAVLPTGEVIVTGGKMVKNSTGYSLQNLIVGSEGTLAVITEAVLRLLPLPRVTVSMLVPFPSGKDAITAVPELVRSSAPLTAIEFMERETLLFAEEYLGKRFPDTSAPAYLLLTADGGDRHAVDAALSEAAELCLKGGAPDAYYVDTDERKAAVWTARGAFLEAIKASTTVMDECDVVVPRSCVADYVRFAHETAERLGLRIPLFGHAGDGNLHLYLCRDALPDDAWREKLEAAFALLYARARELRGQVSGEHGVGYAKKAYMAESLGPAQIALMRGIKAVFDPNGILNPGKLF